MPCAIHRDTELSFLSVTPTLLRYVKSINLSDCRYGREELLLETICMKESIDETKCKGKITNKNLLSESAIKYIPPKSSEYCKPCKF